MNVFYTDGACKGNGRYGFQKAYICVTNEAGEVLVDEFVGDHTNIEAEAMALLACFEHIWRNRVKFSIVRTDSKFWVDTIKNNWKLKKQHLFPLRDRLVKGYGILSIDLQWVPREESKAGWHLEKKYEKNWQPKILRAPIAVKSKHKKDKIIVHS